MSISEHWWTRKAANPAGRGANGSESPGFQARKAAREAADEVFAREMGVSGCGMRICGVDKAAWDNSPEMRRAIENELDNWGAWSRQGGRNDLGYPAQIPGATPPDRDPPRPVNTDSAERTEWLLRKWREHGDSGEHGTFLIKLKYVERRILEDIGTHYRRKFKTGHSDQLVAALIDEAEWFYFLLAAR